MNKAILRTVSGYLIAMVLGHIILGIVSFIYMTKFHTMFLFGDAEGTAESLQAESGASKIIPLIFFSIVPAIFVWLGLKVTPQNQRKYLVILSAILYTFFPFFSWGGIHLKAILPLTCILWVGWYTLRKKPELEPQT